MWEPRRLTTLWGSMACYRDSFTLLFLHIYYRLSTTFIYVFGICPILLLRDVSAVFSVHHVHVFLLKLFHCTSNCISSVNGMLIYNCLFLHTWTAEQHNQIQSGDVYAHSNSTPTPIRAAYNNTRVPTSRRTNTAQRIPHFNGYFMMF
jgi:hypothetical protein